MTIELALLISIVSVTFGVFSGVANMRRNSKTDDKREATQLTTVIIKLESIESGISEIKAEMRNVKQDVKDLSERIIRAEESCKQAHKRIDSVEKKE